MGTLHVTIGDLPDSFMDVVKQEFVDFSVALARVRDGAAGTFTPLGSGVLVKKGDRFGILTARHCLHACTPAVQLGASGGDTLALMLRGGRCLLVRSYEAIEHLLVTPKSEEFGPDLTFIEILPGTLLASFKAIGSFWPLNRHPDEIIGEFGGIGTLIATIGFPEVDYHTQIDGQNIHHSARHMAYIGGIGEGDVFERNGWDYVEANCDYSGSPDLPHTFKGVSGGPIWGMRTRKHKSDGHFSIEKFALIGIVFYETSKRRNVRRLRGHFIKSIYERAWRNP
jgi:hypothetical protein